MGHMSIRTSPWPAGTPCWVDIAVSDVRTSCRFYEAVLGWSFPEAEADGGGYVMASVDGHDVAGIGPRTPPERPAGWLVYLASDDADATAGAIAGHGGTVLVEPADTGDYGRHLVAADPAGATFGVWQAKEHVGAQLVNQPGGLTWEDLRSSDPAAAQRFYTAVFGFDLQAVEMAPGDYRTFHLHGDDAPLGGMGGLMDAAAGSHWLPYFAVSDADRAVATAGSAGGSVLGAPIDTPYGRMAGLADPDGAPFQVMEVASEQPDRSG